MTKNDDYSERYKIEPCQLVVPGVPLIAKSENLSDIERIQITGIRSLETSATRALRLADDMLKSVQRDLRKGRCKELLKLLQTRPEFSAHPWVRAEVLKWLRTGRSFTKRGRRIGSFKVHPLIVAAIVDELIARQWAPNREKAFVWLADNDWLKYESAKKQYYHALGEDRFRGVLVEGSILSAPQPRFKSRRLMDRAHYLHEGESITRKLRNSVAGPTTVTFSIG